MSLEIRSHDKCDVEQGCHCLSPPSYAWFLQERWLEPGMEYVQQAGSSGSTGSGPAGAKSVKSEHRQNYELGINRDYTVWLHGNTGMLAGRQPVGMRMRRSSSLNWLHCPTIADAVLKGTFCMPSYLLFIIRSTHGALCCCLAAGLVIGVVCWPLQVRQPDDTRIKRYIPFSDGRRDCVGQALARMNYTSTLARLLGNFHFELAPEVRFSGSRKAPKKPSHTISPMQSAEVCTIRCVRELDSNFVALPVSPSLT